MKNIRLFIFAFIAAIIILPSAEATTFNGREYTQISGQWFEVYNGSNFKVVGTEIFVKFVQGTTEQEINTLNTTNGGETIRVNCKGTYLIHSIESPPPDPLEFFEDYLESEIVSSGKNNTEGHFNQPNDPSLNLQIFLNTPEGHIFDNDINVLPVWNDGDGITGNPEILIGVIDSGLLYWHSDIWQNVWQNLGDLEDPDDDEDADNDGSTLRWDGDRLIYDNEGDNGINNNGDLNGVDDDGNNVIDDLIGINAREFDPPHEVGDLNQADLPECLHGTQVAGIIAAMTNNNNQFAGISGGWGNPGSSIIFCRLGISEFTEDHAERALNYLINQTVGVNIINESINFAQNDDIDALLNDAAANEVFITAATGNDNNDGIDYPASHNAVIAVGSSSDNQRSNFSNYGEGLDIVAPSGQTVGNGQGPPVPIVYSTGVLVNENNWEEAADPSDEEELDWCIFGGTSASSPQVASVAALLLSREPLLTRNQLCEILFITTSKDDEGDINYEQGSKYGSWNDEMGYGELNAGNAVEFGRRQEIELEAGWTWISSRMVPFQTEDNGLDDEDGIFLMFDELVDNLELLKNIYGKFWTPEWEYCNIPNWEPLEGYMIDLNANSTWISLGREMAFDTAIQLEPGWNLIAYLPPDYNLEAEDAFEDLWVLPNDTLLKIAKDYEGNFYIPSQEFNNMDALCPGYGYQLYLYEDVEYSYPEEPGGGDAVASKSTLKRVQSIPEHFQIAARTADFYPILINSVSIVDVIPATGDEIGVFTPDGICIGGSAFTGVLPIGISVWEDDTLTVEVDGYRDGETFFLRYWDSDRNVEIIRDSLNIFSDLDSFEEEPVYSKFDLNIQSPTYLTPVSFSLMQNYPNPFNSTTEISYSLLKSSHVELKVYDLTGSLTASLVNARQASGMHRFIWDGRNETGTVMPSGLYFYRIVAQYDKGEIYKATRQMVIIK